MRVIRWFLGKIILMMDAMFPPVPVKRDASAQAKVDALSSRFSLYQFEACPFCVKVRRAAKRMNVKLELRDAANEPKFRDELARDGGNIQVPCLKIALENGKAQWLYESSDIIAYLERELAAVGL